MTDQDVRELDLSEQQRLRAKWNEEYAVAVEYDRPEGQRWVAYPSYGPSRKPLLEATPVALDYAMAHKYTDLIRGGLHD